VDISRQPENHIDKNDGANDQDDALSGDLKSGEFDDPPQNEKEENGSENRGGGPEPYGTLFPGCAKTPQDGKKRPDKKQNLRAFPNEDEEGLSESTPR